MEHSHLQDQVAAEQGLSESQFLGEKPKFCFCPTLGA